MIKVREGSLWRGSGSDEFRVLSVVVIESKVWVHYRRNDCNPLINHCQEYSCYQESFLERFRPCPE